MKKVIFAMAFLFGASALAIAPTQLGTLGAGVHVGTSSAVTVQRVFNEVNSAQFGVGADNENVLAYGDYLWYMDTISQIHPYVGLGAGVEYDDDPGADDEFLGMARLPVGVSFYPDNASLNIFGQAVPLLDTSGDGDLEAQVGLRYFFQ